MFCSLGIYRALPTLIRRISPPPWRRGFDRPESPSRRTGARREAGRVESFPCAGLTARLPRELRGASVREEFAAQVLVVSGGEGELEWRDGRSGFLDVPLRGLDELGGR